MNTPDAEHQIAEFAGRYTPEIALALQRCRERLRAHFPRGFELVYDNYNALVCAFGPSERSSEAVLSLAAYPRWVTLFFLKGANLPDPESLLQGSGSEVRSIRLHTPEDLDIPAVSALIARAQAPVGPALAGAQVLKTIVKSVSAKQRPRRAKEAGVKVLKTSGANRARSNQ
jgi:Domain of unknown function (DU1801)